MKDEHLERAAIVLVIDDDSAIRGPLIGNCFNIGYVPDTMRIILSGFAELESVIDALNRGAVYRFFTKPWDDQLLRDQIRDAFEHQWRLHGKPDAMSYGASGVTS